MYRKSSTLGCQQYWLQQLFIVPKLPWSTLRAFFSSLEFLLIIFCFTNCTNLYSVFVPFFCWYAGLPISFWCFLLYTNINWAFLFSISGYLSPFALGWLETSKVAHTGFFLLSLSILIVSKNQSFCFCFNTWVLHLGYIPERAFGYTMYK